MGRSRHLFEKNNHGQHIATIVCYYCMSYIREMRLNYVSKLMVQLCLHASAFLSEFIHCSSVTLQCKLLSVIFFGCSQHCHRKPASDGMPLSLLNRARKKQGFFEEGLIGCVNIKYLSKFSLACPEVAIWLNVLRGVCSLLVHSRNIFQKIRMGEWGKKCKNPLLFLTSLLILLTLRNIQGV